MADASAPALIGGGDYWAMMAGGRAEITRIADAWARASFKIESRLRVYFSPQVVVAWQLYSWFVTRWDATHSIQSMVDMVTAGRTGFKNLDTTLVRNIRDLFLVADNLQERGCRVSYRSTRTRTALNGRPSTACASASVSHRAYGKRILHICPLATRSRRCCFNWSNPWLEKSLELT